jgi:hypothetical protein
MNHDRPAVKKIPTATGSNVFKVNFAPLLRSLPPRSLVARAAAEKFGCWMQALKFAADVASSKQHRSCQYRGRTAVIKVLYGPIFTRQAAVELE